MAKTQSSINFICAILLAACAGVVQPTAESEEGVSIDGVEQPTAESMSDVSLLLVENFDDAETCFNREVAPYDVLEIENGEFIMGVNESAGLIWSTCEGLELDNFTFEMDVYDETGGEGFRFFGLQFRKGSAGDGSDQYYLVRFGFGGDRSPASCVGLASDSSWIDNLTQSTSGDSCWVDLSDPIQPGEWNHFEITTNGSEITYKVNDALVSSVNDSRLTQGRVALLAGTNDEDNARFKIDNIRITAPTD